MSDAAFSIASIEQAPPVVPAAASVDIFARKHDGSRFVIDGPLTTDVFDELLVWAGDRKASDITFQTDCHVLAEIGSEIVPISNRETSPIDLDRIIAYLYGEHGPGTIKAAYDIDVAHEVTDPRRRNLGRKRYRCNVTGVRIPGGSGCQITVRTLPSSPIPIENLDVEPEIIANFRPRQGMVLVTGPTGSGKSTLLSSGIRHVLEKPDANEKYLEYASPIEYVYDQVVMPSSSVAQTEVGKHLRPHVSADDVAARKNEESLYAYAIRNALRRKPTIIGVGEIRDRATMQAAIEAALTGHLLYSTTHVTSVPATLARMVQFFPHDQRAGVASDMMESLRLVITQLLYPRAGGGKVALREYMIFDEQTRAKFMRRPVDEWPSLARALLHGGGGNGRSMVESSWLAFQRGDITSTTYKRIMQSQRDAA